MSEEEKPILIIKFCFKAFAPLYIFGPIQIQDKTKIQRIQNSMSLDEYAGYYPQEQAKYEQIKEILKGYRQPEIYEYGNEEN